MGRGRSRKGSNVLFHAAGEVVALNLLILNNTSLKTADK
jgi:hypothetical protein